MQRKKQTTTSNNKPVAAGVLDIKGFEIPYQLYQTTHRRARMKMRPDGTLEIRYVSKQITPVIIQFINKNQDWIIQQLFKNRACYANYNRFKATAESINGVLIYGAIRSVCWQQQTDTALILENDKLIVQSPAPPPNNRRILERAFAQESLIQTLNRWAERMGLVYSQVRIKQMRSRWGSCSAKQNINLNWRLILLPAELCECVIVHELVHLIEMNHSAAFYKHMKEALPDYQARDKEMNNWSWVLAW
jgi:predicted metal-dependent hydrolase